MPTYDYPRNRCSYELLLPQLDNMVDAVVAAPPSHAKNQRDKEAKLEREREERERERQKAAAAAAAAQLAAQGTIRWVGWREALEAGVVVWCAVSW